VVEIKIETMNQGESLRESDQIVYVVNGQGGLAVDPVCDRDIDAILETYRREGDTYTGGRIRSKCRCGCSG